MPLGVNIPGGCFSRKKYLLGGLAGISHRPLSVFSVFHFFKPIFQLKSFFLFDILFLYIMLHIYEIKKQLRRIII